MPKPERGERRSHFVNRCIPIVIKDGAAKNPKQAIAICESMFDNRHRKMIDEESN